eukprot:gene1927-2105_t
MGSADFFSVTSSFPSVNPAWTILIYFVIPLLPLFVGLKRKDDRKWRGGKVYSSICKITNFVNENSPFFAIGQFCWTVVLVVNQGSYSYSHMKFAYDVSYYSRVDSADFRHLSATQYLGTYNSLDALNGHNGGSASGFQSSSVRAAALLDDSHRRLQISSIDSNLTLSYHLSSWDNVLTEESLRNICLIEKNILANPGCIGSGYYSSAIPTIFNSSCHYKHRSFDYSLTLLGLESNSLYVSDFVNQYRPESEVLLSYFGIGTCESLDTNEFQDLLDDYEADGIEITYTSKELNKKLLKNMAGNTLLYLVIATIVAFVVLALGVRGLIVPLITLLCLVVAFVNSTAFIGLIGYNYFPISNSAGVLITLIYACNAVNTFGSSWRTHVKKGFQPSVPNILNTYRTFGHKFLYITSLACICLFVLASSDIIVIRQFGLFTGFSVLSFYLFFHYVILPVWLLGAMSSLNRPIYKFFRKARKYFCGSCQFLNSIGMVDTLAAAMILGGDDDDSERNDRQEPEPPEEESIVQPERIVFVGSDPNQPDDGVGNSSNQTAIVAASPLDETVNLGATDPELEEATFDTQFCRGKRPLKLLGFLYLLIVFVALAIVYGVTITRFGLVTGIPKIFPTSSNLGKEMRILEKYKNDLLESHISGAGLSTVVFQAPTARPTAAPSGVTRSPSARPTYAPTTQAPPQSVNYQIRGCWGINADLDDPDDIAEGEFDFDSFAPYVSKGGLPSDMQALCNYVDSNRHYLSVVSEWNATKDCIYSPYIRVYNSLPNSLKTYVNAFTVWGKQDTANSYSVGYFSQSNTTSPVWVCANFSVVSNISSIGGDPGEVKQVRDRWKSAFADHATTSASSYGVPVITSSPAFTYPLLSHTQADFLKICLAATIVGFVGLLFIFTLSDFGLTVFGSLSIFTTLSVSLCLHIFFSSDEIDLWDIVVLQSIMLIVVDFPVYLIEEYMSARAFADKQTTTAIDKVLSPALARTNKNMRWAIVAPIILMVCSSIPALFAKLEILARAGEYIIIVTLVSTIMTIFIQPYLLAFGCRTKICEKFCYIEEEYEEYVDALPPAAASLPPEHSPNEGDYAEPGSPQPVANPDAMRSSTLGAYDDDGQTVVSAHSFHSPGSVAGSMSGSAQGSVQGSQTSLASAQRHAAYSRHASQLMYRQPTQSQLISVPSEYEMAQQGVQTMRPHFASSQYGAMIGPDGVMYQGQGMPPGPMPPRGSMQYPPQQQPMPMSRHPSMMQTYPGPPRLHPIHSMYARGPMSPPNMPPRGGPGFGSVPSMPMNDMYPPPPPQGMYGPGPQGGGIPLMRGPSQYGNMPPPSPGGGVYPPRPRPNSVSFYDAPQY